MALSLILGEAHDETFQELAGKARSGCPVSKLLNAAITLDATLTG